MATTTDVNEYLSDFNQSALALEVHARQLPRTNEEYVAYSQKLIEIRNFKKLVAAKLAELEKPFKLGLKNLRAEFKKVLGKITDTETALGNGILVWRNQERVEAEAKAKKEMDSYEKALRKDVKKGGDGSSIALPIIEESVSQRVATDQGSMGSRFLKRWRFKGNPEITSQSKVKVCRDESCTEGLPDSFFILDYVALNNAIKAGLDFPNLIIYEEEILEVRK